MKKQAIMVIVIGAVVLSAVAGCLSKEEIVTIHSSGVLDGEVSRLWYYHAVPFGFPDQGMNYYAACDSPVIRIGATYSSSGDPMSGSWSWDQWTYRALLSFDLSRLAGKAVTKAMLKVHLETSAGDPFAIFENLVVEHVDYGTDTPAGGDQDLFQAKLFTPAFSGIMSAAGGDWWIVDATPAVLAALEAGHGYAQYRLYFQGDIDNQGNHTASMDAGDSAADKPELSVTCR